VLILEISPRGGIIFSGNAGGPCPAIDQLVRCVGISQATVLEGAVALLCLDQRAGDEVGTLQIVHSASREKCEEPKGLIAGLRAVRFAALLAIRWTIALEETRPGCTMQVHLRFEEVKRSIRGCLPSIDVRSGAGLVATNGRTATACRCGKGARDQ